VKWMHKNGCANKYLRIKLLLFIIITVIVHNAMIRVTLSWITLQGHSLYRASSNLKTKQSAAGWSRHYAIVSSKSYVFRRLRNDGSGGASLPVRTFMSSNFTAEDEFLSTRVNVSRSESVSRRKRRVFARLRVHSRHALLSVSSRFQADGRQDALRR